MTSQLALAFEEASKINKESVWSLLPEKASSICSEYLYTEKEIVDFLIPKLQDKSSTMLNASALLTLSILKGEGFVRSETVVPFVIECLKHQDGNIRLAAAEAAYIVFEKELIQPLIEAVEQESVYVIKETLKYSLSCLSYIAQFDALSLKNEGAAETEATASSPDKSSEN